VRADERARRTEQDGVVPVGQAGGDHDGGGGGDQPSALHPAGRRGPLRWQPSGET
jgi:hypothetical protein